MGELDVGSGVWPMVRSTGGDDVVHGGQVARALLVAQVAHTVVAGVDLVEGEVLVLLGAADACVAGGLPRLVFLGVGLLVGPHPGALRLGVGCVVLKPVGGVCLG